MSIGILECGQPPAELRDGHGTYAAMMQRMLGGSRPATAYAVTDGVLPERAGQHRAYVLTGSPAGVYDDLPWIPKLLDFLRQAHGQTLLVGICFGHQAMAQAFGGRVVKSDKGWGVGLHRYGVQPHDNAWMEPAGEIHAAAFHQDQVVEAPPDARVTAASPFTPLAGLDYGDAISFQFHPEFDAAFSTALIQARTKLYGPLAQPAIDSYARPQDGPRVANWIGRFVDAGR